MDSFKALLEARIQQAIAAKRKSSDCEEWSPRRRNAEIGPKPPATAQDNVKHKAVGAV